MVSRRWLLDYCPFPLPPNSDHGTFSARKNPRSGRMIVGHCSLSVSLGDNRDHWPTWGPCSLPRSLSSLLSAPALAQESCLAGKLRQVGGERKAVRQKQLPASVEEDQGPSGYGQKARRGSALAAPPPHVWVLGLFPQPFPCSLPVQRADCAYAKLWAETDLRGHLVQLPPYSGIRVISTISSRGLPASGPTFPGNRSSPPPKAVCSLFGRKQL